MVQSGTYTSHPAAFFDQPFAAPHQSAGSEVPSDSFPPGEAKWCKPLACTLYYRGLCHPSWCFLKSGVTGGFYPPLLEPHHPLHNEYGSRAAQRHHNQALVKICQYHRHHQRRRTAEHRGSVLQNGREGHRCKDRIRNIIQKGLNGWVRNFFINKDKWYRTNSISNKRHDR